ncbi:MAG: UpxY family transcription antiterminator [Bacteroidetes bacterium]|nr:UpxY family transcription antiterminator [Bacteroidota bacterium]
MTDPASALRQGFPGERSSWYVIYVKARHEKRASADLAERGIESYLPMRMELHQWSDRKKRVEVPLFSCYVFVRTSPGEFNRVYLASGFVKFVGSNGRPSVIPDNQIDDVKRIVEYHSEDVEVLEGSYTGRKAEVTAGPLSGLRGEIVEILNRKSFVIRIEGLDKLLSVNVPVSAVRLIEKPGEEGMPRRTFPDHGVTSATS